MSEGPVFAFVTMGSGDFLGATVRDLALANALHRRGYKVAVYWMMETNEEMADQGIVQRILCHGTRYHFARPSWLLDAVLGRLLFLLPKAFRVRVVQGRSGYVDRLLGNLVSAMFGSVDGDAALGRKLAHFVARDGVTHLMMSYASLGPLAMTARRLLGSFDYLLTFQGDEQFAAHASQRGLLDRYRTKLGQVLGESPWPAIAVSADYIERLVDELAVPRDKVEVVYNGVEQPVRGALPSFARVQEIFSGLSPHFPIVVYLGRQDVEKGIDLLLYAARQLVDRKVPLQLVVCGSTAKGTAYRKVLIDLAEHLNLKVFHAGSVPTEVRDALFAHSHCVVYPSVNREPFGLVVAEAMSHGTPVLVPDYGGIGEVIQQGGKVGGLTFRAWDSGDLAAQLERLLVDRTLHRRLAANTRDIAARFSVDHMTDDVLAHIGVEAPLRLAQAGAA